MAASPDFLPSGTSTPGQAQEQELGLWSQVQTEQKLGIASETILLLPQKTGNSPGKAADSHGRKGAASLMDSWLWVMVCVFGILMPLAILFFSLASNRARWDSGQLWNIPRSEVAPVVWEPPGCILTLDSRYNPEGVLAVEAAVARLIRDLRGAGAKGGVKSGGGEEVRGGDSGGAEEESWEKERRGRMRGRQEREEGEKRGEKTGMHGDGRDGRMPGRDGRVPGRDGRIPELWRRFYESLPKMFDSDGKEYREKMPIWVTLAVNMLYARRHGYRLVAENGSKYTQDRHPSWFKVPFLQEQLSCCCKWAFFLDSDAYMRMDHHRLSVEGWVQGLKQPNYFHRLLEANLTDSLAGQVWVPQDPGLLLQPSTALQPEGPVALIPRNGDARGGYVGDASMLFTKDHDYINAGVMVWRRSPDSFKFFEQWYNLTEDEYHRYNHVWEQSNLNNVAREEQWRGKVIIVPYHELTGPEGAMVRHVWGTLLEGDFDKAVFEALNEALGWP